MIIVYSFNHVDEPTTEVIDWLTFYNANFLKINGEDTYINSKFCIDFKNQRFKNNTHEFNFHEVNTVFYRRWYKNLNDSSFYNQFISKKSNESDVKLVNKMLSFIHTEYNASITAYFDSLSNAKWFPFLENIQREKQKMEVLRVVEKNGLKVPATIITTSKKEVINFYNFHQKKIITKPIKDVYPIYIDDTEINMYTKKIDQEQLDSMPETFFPCLFQEQIEKFFEIRVFFIENDFYSMFIFSQSDEQTKVDFRNYNYSKPNRFVPYNIPNNIKNILKKSMKELNINTGSIDIILTPENEYYFLEVNIVGQLGMVSHSCNYNLESIIAKRLMKYDENRKN